MKLSFKYRLSPNQSQINNLNKTLDLCRFLYNSALQERISFYKTYHQSRFYSKQSELLPELKKYLPEYKNIHSQVLQSTLKRLDRSYKFFFKGKSKFPRFKNKDRFRSFLYPQKGFSVEQKNNCARLFLSKIGHIKMNLHRPILGNIKTCQIIKTSTNKWYVRLSCNKVPKEPQQKTNKIIGLDLGVKTYITTSDNEVIENPKHLNNSLSKLKLAQQKLSEFKKTDVKRHAAKQHVARLYEKVKNQRNDFQHKVSKKLIQDNDQIFVEDLNIKDMKSFRNLNRAIKDCAWSKFVNKLSYKAEKADKKVTKVDPRNTSKMCSNCGKMVEKDLSIRIHRCECGLVMNRDLNAAINILNRGLGKIPKPRKSG